MHRKRITKAIEERFRRAKEFGGLMKALGRKPEEYVWCTGPGTMAPSASAEYELHSTMPPVSQQLIFALSRHHCEGTLSPQRLGSLVRRYRAACLNEGRPLTETDRQIQVIRARYSRSRN